MSDPTATRMRGRFAVADSAFRKRVPRERMLLSAMLIAAVGFTFDSLALRPLEQERGRIESMLVARRDQIGALESQIAAARNPVVDEAERARRDEIRQLEQQIAEIDGAISTAVSQLVPPEAAVEVLEELLAHDGRLELVNLTSQQPRRLGAEETRGASTLYHHGLRIEIQGDFTATLDYLRRIEQSDWQLLWDRFEYHVESFPDARVTIELHTLSEREEWVGV
jgi:MSHA biogenesis protein MshJ